MLTTRLPRAAHIQRAVLADKVPALSLLDGPAAIAQQFSRPRAGRRSIAPDDFAVHDDDIDAFRTLGRVLEIGRIDDSFCIEERDVGMIARPQRAAAFEAEF